MKKQYQAKVEFLRSFVVQRKQLNGLLRKQVTNLYGEGYLSQQIWDRINKGRKVRSLLFLEIAKSLNRSFRKSESILNLCLAMEMIHAASCLIDDIIDGDEIRHGSQASKVVLGTPVSALQSHFLCAEALKLLSHNHVALRLLVEAYEKLSVGETFDMFLPTTSSGWWSLGYTECIYQKTSAMFELAFEFGAISAGRENQRLAMRRLGHELGKLYQLSNDYHDMQPHNLIKRHGAADSWRVTCSLPVATYLMFNGRESLEKEVKTQILTFAQWQGFLRKIWTPDVKRHTEKLIRNCLVEISCQVKESCLTPVTKARLINLSNVVATENFWYHPYDK